MRTGQLTWNGVPISNEQFDLFLRATRVLLPQPRLIVDTTGMDCAVQQRLVAAVTRANVDCSGALCVATPYRSIVAPPAPHAPPRR